MRVRRLFTDPAGRLVTMETQAREFTPAMAAFVKLRDQRCANPWCGAPIPHIVHILDWAQGGPTSLVNAQGLCEACNYSTNAPGWQSIPQPDGSVRLITPTGHDATTFTTAPAPQPAPGSPPNQAPGSPPNQAPGSPPDPGPALIAWPRPAPPPPKTSPPAFVAPPTGSPPPFVPSPPFVAPQAASPPAWFPPPFVPSPPFVAPQAGSPPAWFRRYSWLHRDPRDRPAAASHAQHSNTPWL